MRLTRSRSSVLLVCAIGILMLAGCAPTLHRPLDPADVARIEQTSLRATVSQEEVTIYVVKSTAGDDIAAGGGLCCMLIGSMVDKQVDASRSRRAEAWVAPLLEQTADVDFRKDYWEALLPALRSLPWFKLGETELMVGGEELPEDWNEKNVMLVSSVYQLTPEGRILTVVSDVRFWNEPKSKPSYFAVHTYASKAVDAEEGEPALAIWSANGAELYRAALTEGIRENMRMIRLDFPDSELRTDHMSGSPAKIRIPPLFGGGSTKHSGEILDRNDERIIFRLSNDNLVSLAIADVVIEEK